MVCKCFIPFSMLIFHSIDVYFAMKRCFNLIYSYLIILGSCVFLKSIKSLSNPISWFDDDFLNIFFLFFFGGARVELRASCLQRLCTASATPQILFNFLNFEHLFSSWISFTFHLIKVTYIYSFGRITEIKDMIKAYISVR
jgi:hypothetical protein